MTPVPLLEYTRIREPTLQPSQVLDHRHRLGNLKVLVAWKGQELAEATWELHEDFCARYPEFHVELEDELNLEGKAVDTAQLVNGLNQASKGTFTRPKRIPKKPAKLLD